MWNRAIKEAMVGGNGGDEAWDEAWLGGGGGELAHAPSPALYDHQPDNAYLQHDNPFDEVGGPAKSSVESLCSMVTPGFPTRLPPREAL